MLVGAFKGKSVWLCGGLRWVGKVGIFCFGVYGKGMCSKVGSWAGLGGGKGKGSGRKGGRVPE